MSADEFATSYGESQTVLKDQIAKLTRDLHDARNEVDRLTAEIGRLRLERTRLATGGIAVGDAASIMRERHLEPIIAMIDLYDQSTDPDFKLNVLKELNSMIRSKKKAIEVREEKDLNITVKINRFGNEPAPVIDVTPAIKELSQGDA